MLKFEDYEFQKKYLLFTSSVKKVVFFFSNLPMSLHELMLVKINSANIVTDLQKHISEWGVHVPGCWARLGYPPAQAPSPSLGCHDCVFQPLAPGPVARQGLPSEAEASGRSRPATPALSQAHTPPAPSPLFHPSTGKTQRITTRWWMVERGSQTKVH